MHIRLKQQQTSFYTHKPIAKQKVSLKNIKPAPQLQPPTQKSTTCNSICLSNNKQSIKNLLVAARSRNHYSQNYISMTYEDIKANIPVKQQHFLSSFLCSLKVMPQESGCDCGQGSKCPWMDHWLTLSMKTPTFSTNKTPVSKQTQLQIRKDLPRTQPNSQFFQSEHTQHILYQCLMAYAQMDSQIAYIQGMNIVASILIYHSLDAHQCMQVLCYLMQSCQFRKVYLNDFEYAHKIMGNLVQALKYRCSDLHRHLIEKYSVNLGIFAIGWILPMLGNIVPLAFMHKVVNTFIEKGWEGILKIILAMLLYLRPRILKTHDETQLLELLSIQGLKSRLLPWEEIILSSYNLKTGSYLSQKYQY